MCCPKAKMPLVLRKPPPLLRPHNGGSPMHGMMDNHLNTVSSKTEEEYNTEMGGGSNCSYVAGQTRPYYFRRCKRKMIKATKIESLPADIILEILVRVPAQDIYKATRFVCRKWYKIIHTRQFIHAHLQQSTCGLLALDRAMRRPQLTFVATGKDLIEISKLNHEFRRLDLSSCNGLVLEPHDNRRDLYITNPATKQHFALPSFLANVLPCGYAIAYAATSMEYKVVRAFFQYDAKHESFIFESQDDCVAILTAGVDKDWTRRVNTQHLSVTAKNLLFYERPFTTEGFVHWARNDCSEYVLTLNVETEIITQFPAPSLLRHDGETELIYLPMGSYLSLLISRSMFSWEFWEMKPETGEWTKMPNIDLEAQFAGSKNCILTPVGWSRSREVLVFSDRNGFSRQGCFVATPFCFACNVRTSKVQKFEINGGMNSFLVHRNSLVWMDGC